MKIIFLYAPNMHKIQGSRILHIKKIWPKYLKLANLSLTSISSEGSFFKFE